MHCGQNDAQRLSERQAAFLCQASGKERIVLTVTFVMFFHVGCCVSFNENVFVCVV